MRDRSLADLNFREILDYGGQPEVRFRYDQPLTCRGYCIDCEESGVLAKSGGELTLMSHACDSADYEAVLGPMKRTNSDVNAPVLFLLQDPGSDSRYGNGVEVSFRGLTKKPPVNHYYWSPRGESWPTQISEFLNDSDYYGRYFAYLMQHHQLVNVYITNVIKCKWMGPNRTATQPAVIRHCANRFLKREVGGLAPRLVVCFGGEAYRGFRDHVARLVPNGVAVRLFHPSYIRNYSQVDSKRRSKQQLFEANDELLQSTLRNLDMPLRRRPEGQ